MATGAIGSSAIDTEQLAGANSYFSDVYPISSTVVLVTRLDNSGVRHASTWAVDGSGNIGSQICAEVTLVGTGDHVLIEYVGANIYAVFGKATGFTIETLNISTDGTIITHLANYTYSTVDCNDRFYTRPKRVPDTNVWVVGYSSNIVGGNGLSVNTYSISTDGLTISHIDEEHDATGGNPEIVLTSLSDNYYAFLRSDATNGTFIKTYQVNDTGTITAIESYTISSGIGSGCSIGSLSNNHYVCGYKSGADYKLATIEISVVGVIGSVKDTLDILFAPYGDILSLGDDVYYYSNGTYHRTVSISTVGIFGSAVDSEDYTGVAQAHLSPRRLGGNIYAQTFTSSTNYCVLRTIYIETTPAGGIYPSDSIMRVTPLVHRWTSGKPGLYQLEIGLGGLSSEYVPPVSPNIPTPSLPKSTYVRTYTFAEYHQWALENYMKQQFKTAFPNGWPTYQEFLKYMSSNPPPLMY